MMADRSGNVHSIPLGTAKGSRIKIIKPTTSICFRAWRCIHVGPFVSLLLKHKAVTGLQNCAIYFLYGFFRPGIELARLSDLVLLPFCNNNSGHFNPAGYDAAAGWWWFQEVDFKGKKRKKKIYNTLPRAIQNDGCDSRNYPTKSTGRKFFAG